MKTETFEQALERENRQMSREFLLVGGVFGFVFGAIAMLVLQAALS